MPISLRRRRTERDSRSRKVRRPSRWRRPSVCGERCSREVGKRDSRIIAFGGGSVGDLAGYAAGCFLRGISFLQIPTTLLAQVDASIGGKTGINLPEAKNSVGLFYHPWATVADTRFLGTLPVEELGAGLMEVREGGSGAGRGPCSKTWRKSWMR